MADRNDVFSRKRKQVLETISKRNDKKKSSIREKRLRLSYEDLAVCEVKCKNISGFSLPTFLTFISIFSLILAPRSDYTGRKSLFNGSDALVLFFYRSRSAASPKTLSDVFGVTKWVISRTFLETINPIGCYSLEQLRSEPIKGDFFYRNHK